MRAIALTLLALWLAGCTTFALVGDVTSERTNRDGRRLTERIVGLIACPTPRGNTIVLIPLYKSSAPRSSASNLPASAQRWMQEQGIAP